MTLTTVGLDELEKRWRRVLTRTPSRLRSANRQFRPVLLAALVKHASGRPGPERRSGEYVNRMQVEPTNDGFGLTAWNDSPQAHRLEAGFVGIDSLGRHYAQPPYPVFQPTLLEMVPLYREAIQREVVSEISE